MIKAKDAECFNGLATAERRFIEHANRECDMAARSLEQTYKATLRAIQEKRIANTVQTAHFGFIDDHRDRVSA